MSVTVNHNRRNDNSTGNWRVDVHHHVVPPEFTDDSMPIKLPDTEAQLRSMDSWHIQSAVTSLTPRVLLKNLHRLREVARICNEFQARRIAEHPARFGAFALLPMPDVDGAISSHARSRAWSARWRRSPTRSMFCALTVSGFFPV